MKALVIGLGSIGMRHARNLKTLGITSLLGADPTPERQHRFETELSGQAFANEDDGLAENPDLVLVCSPNRFHLSQATKAAQKGCALLIEKPLGTNYQDAQKFTALIKEKNIYAHMGSNWKFHPAFICMKKWLDEGRIGTVTGAQVLAGQWLPDWHPWEDYRLSYSARKDLDGGAIFDTHELDYLTWLLGPVQDFIGLKAHSGTLPIETEDVAAAVMRLESGALVSVLTDYIQRVGRRRYHISGDKGTIEWDISIGNVILSLPKEPEAEIFKAQVEDLNEMYLEQTRHVLNALKTGQPPMTPISHMLDVLELQTKWHNDQKS